jgi:hypothetical protein
VEKVKPNPAILDELGVAVQRVERRERLGLLGDTNPRTKLDAGFDYLHGRWAGHANVQRYGNYTVYSNSGPSLDQNFAHRWTLDLSADYNLDSWTFSAGADNVQCQAGAGQVRQFDQRQLQVQPVLAAQLERPLLLCQRDLPVEVMTMRVLLPALLLTIAAAVPAQTAAPAAQSELEQRVDASIATANIDGWLRRLTSAPNQVGSPHDKENADFIAASLRSWGWQVAVEQTRVLVAYPTVQKLSLLGADNYAADFTEPAIEGDKDTATREGVLPGMEAYSADGSVDAPLIFVNEGLSKDYDELARVGQSVEGKVVLVKSTGAGRWVKPRLAQQHGAVGVVIYSDPDADGFTKGDVYPEGAWRTPHTLQRGTLGIDSVLDAKSATTFQANRHTDDLHLPVVTIGYGDAEHFLRALGGSAVPNRWQGGLPLTYHVGGDAKVHLEVRSPWEWRTLYNVVGTLRGSEFPDEWVIRGVHHDAWMCLAPGIRWRAPRPCSPKPGRSASWQRPGIGRGARWSSPVGTGRSSASSAPGRGRIAMRRSSPTRRCSISTTTPRAGDFSLRRAIRRWRAWWPPRADPPEHELTITPPPL